MTVSGFLRVFATLRSGELVRRTIEFSVLHGAAVGLTWFIIHPVQGAMIDAEAAGALVLIPVLLFLPAIIKTLAAWMYGWWAAIYILPTALWQHLLLGLSWRATDLLLIGLYVSVAPLARSCLHLVGLNQRPPSHLRTWRSMFAMMVISSVILASAYLLIYEGQVLLQEALLFIVLCVLGDAAGAALVLILFVAFFRAKDRATRPLFDQNGA